MNKIYTGIILKTFFTLLFFCGGVYGYGQIAGDFQPKNISGNFSDFNSWNIYNGSIWLAATAGQIPNSTTSIFFTANKAIAVDISTASCKDINLTTTGITEKFTFNAGSILRIYGSLLQTSNTNIPFTSFSAGAKIIFTGSANQTIVNSGANTNLFNVEINKTGGIFTFPGVNTKYDDITLTAGTVVGAGATVLIGTASSTITINGGTWTQITGANRINGGAPGINVALTINAGSMNIGTSSGGLAGFNFSFVNVINFGTLTLTEIAGGNFTIGNALSIDATSTLNSSFTITPSPPILTSINFAGTINYTKGGSQTLIDRPYGNLGLSGSVNKTPVADVTVLGNITISGAAVFLPSPFNITVGGNWANYGTAGFTEATSTVIFNGTSAQILNTSSGEDFFKVIKTSTGTLTLSSDVRFGGTSSELNILSGIVDAGTNTLSGSAATSLIMSGGILKLSKPVTILPEFPTVAGYNLTATSTIELNGIGNQILRGARDYRNLTFSTSGTKTVSSPPSSITGTVYVTGSAILDIASSTFGSAATNLKMDASSRFRMGGTSTKPDIDGTYTLTGGTIEFYNSLGTTQTIKGTNAASVDIIYNQIEVTGSNVGQSNTDIILNSAGGKFSVIGTSFVLPAVMYMSNRSIKSSAASNTSSILINGYGTMVTNASKGFSGFITTFSDNSSINGTISAANITLNSGSTVNYARTGNQDISNQVPYQNFIISNAGNKIAPSGTLEINGNINGTGSAFFLHNNGTVLLNGILGQTYAAANPFTFYNLTNNSTPATNGFTINDSINIIKELKLNTLSALKLNTGSITLKSNQSLNANLAQVPAGEPNIIQYPGVGRFFVERYINSGRKWRFLSVPADAETGTIRSNWMEGAANKDQDLKPGYGTLVTDNTSNAIAVGFDTLSLSGPSIKNYVAGANIFNGITNPDLLLNGQEGYMSFIRGDRTARLNNNLVTPTILRTKGKLITGTKNISIPANNNYVAVGNPYPSAIDLKTIIASSSGIASTVAIWDPKLTGSFGLGAFQYITQLLPGADFIISPGGGSFGSIGSIVNNIQSGSAFFVRASGLGGTVSITETAKTTNFTDVYFTGDNHPQSFGCLLQIKNTTGTATIVDGIFSYFTGNGNNAIDFADAPKLSNTQENISAKRENNLFAVEQRRFINLADTIFLNLAGLRVASYQWKFVPANMDAPTRECYLIDKYLNTVKPLSLTTASLIDFDVENAGGSYAADRFMIVFKQQPDASFKFTGINATRQSDKEISINFFTAFENQLEVFTIERSYNGIDFTAAGTTPVLQNNGASASYHFNDIQSNERLVYYRIKARKTSGEDVFSDIVKVKAGHKTALLSIVPNPVKDKIIHIVFRNSVTGKYNIYLINNIGQLLIFSSVQLDSSIVVKDIFLPDTIVGGTYQLIIINEAGKKEWRSVVVE